MHKEKIYNLNVVEEGELALILKKELALKLNKRINILALTFSSRYQQLTVHYEEI